MKLAFLRQILDVPETSSRSVAHKVGGVKASLVTTLSVVGILATSGAALAANTKVLDSVISSVQDSLTLAEAIEPFEDQSIELANTGGVVAVDTTVLDSPASSVPTDTSVPVTDLLVGSTTSVVAAVTSATTIAPTPGATIAPTPGTTVAPTPGATVAPTPGTTVAPASVQSAYNIPGVGIITLKQDATSLKILSVNPVSGWTYKAENTHATRVEVEFETGHKSVKFRAELLNGRVVVAVSVDDEVANDEAFEAAAKAEKEAFEAAAKAEKEAFEAAAKAEKEAFEAAAKAAKSACDSAETAVKEACEAAAKAVKEAFEAAAKAEKEASEAAAKAEKEAFEAAAKAEKEALEAAAKAAEEDDD